MHSRYVGPQRQRGPHAAQEHKLPQTCRAHVVLEMLKLGQWSAGHKPYPPCFPGLWANVPSNALSP